MKQTKKKIIYFTSFDYLGTLNTSFNNFLNILIKNFDKVIIVNSDNLRILTKKKFYYKNKSITKNFNKKISFFNPINYNDLNKNINFTNSVVVPKLESNSDILRGFLPRKPKENRCLCYVSSSKLKLG